MKRMLRYVNLLMLLDPSYIRDKDDSKMYM